MKNNTFTARLRGVSRFHNLQYNLVSKRDNEIHLKTGRMMQSVHDEICNVNIDL